MIEVARRLQNLPWKAVEYEDHWNRELPNLLNKAFGARNLAYSYREDPFLVGVSILAHNATQARIFTGMNTKFCRDCPKWCGECFAISAAERAGYMQVIGMAIIAQNQRDNESGALLNFLTPCGKCRQFFRKKRHMISPETRIIGVRIPDFFCDGMTIAELYPKHNEQPFE